MKKDSPNDARARDDRHLRDLVSETRRWMKERGIEEEPLDWETIKREERRRWWKDRLAQALAALAGQGREVLEAARSGAAAALEVTLDPARQLGQLLAVPAEACVAVGSGFQFEPRRRSWRDSRGKQHASEESEGVFVTQGIKGAQVLADASAGSLTVEFLEPIPSPVVMLVPEEPSADPLIAELSNEQGTQKAVFHGLPNGRFLLTLYLGKP
jgi:hypothetical protein